MIIKQSIVKKNWCIQIDFEKYTLNHGNGPYYVSGNFNNWNMDDKNYKVGESKQKGTKNLSLIKLKVPSSINIVEFKIFNSCQKTWIEPSSGDNLYKGNLTLVSNSFGTLNVRVDQNTA